ncbi:hypothetical protein NMG60_11021934 [Bertholletia excelsa]
MASERKRMKVVHSQQPQRIASMPATKKDEFTKSMHSSPVVIDQVSNIHQRIQQAKSFAVAQAQQDGCMANFKIFDSPFGNFLVPVIPTRAELG